VHLETAMAGIDTVSVVFFVYNLIQKRTPLRENGAGKKFILIISIVPALVLLSGEFERGGD
jgi:O-antigen/teichoic acid export membrane protein